MELAEVAKIVGKALGRKDDNSDIADGYWFQRCLAWLLERGDITRLSRNGGRFVPFGYEGSITLYCKPEEFPARAVAELLSRPELHSQGYAPTVIERR